MSTKSDKNSLYETVAVRANLPAGSVSNPIEQALKYSEQLGNQDTLNSRLMSEGISNVTGAYQDAIGVIINDPQWAGVDPTLQAGRLQEAFDTTKNRIVDSALASVKKSAIDLDAYLGSSTSDQRSGARFRMATGIKNSMMQSAFRGDCQGLFRSRKIAGGI